MTAPTCPRCGAAIDPLRARAVQVRGGKVVAFCSDACKRDRGANSETKLEPPRPGTIADTADAVVGGGAADSGRECVAVLDPPATVADSAPDDRAAPSPPASVRRRGRRTLALVALIVLAGMAVPLIQAISPGAPVTSSAASIEPPAAAAVDPVVAPAPVPPTPAEARARAVEVLQRLAGSPSLRVARGAGLALARGCDASANRRIRTMRDAESSELAKLAIDYALARCADAAALDQLRAGLVHRRRDVKADAARALVDLGEVAGAGFLHALLEIDRHRLGAAEALAPLRDPKAMAVLAEVRADARAHDDDRMRATIALAIAGDHGVAPAVRAALADPRFRPAAAAALARLGDRAGRDALVAELAVPSLRVDAARALRRLEPDADVAPLLAGLVAALGDERDVSQVSAAEAVLVLTGPADDAERR